MGEPNWSAAQGWYDAKVEPSKGVAPEKLALAVIRNKVH